ncbi:hypothetical protein ILYODFUR_012821 [Ilyodon furcidens]|uniref:Uncharacterized protein n=1 Tax=Ilyodon furcidens TaxID=33524 RepID=A0ABV0V3C1_9TELE
MFYLITKTQSAYEDLFKCISGYSFHKQTKNGSEDVHLYLRLLGLLVYSCSNYGNSSEENRVAKYSAQGLPFTSHDLEGNSQNCKCVSLSLKVVQPIQLSMFPKDLKMKHSIHIWIQEKLWKKHVHSAWRKRLNFSEAYREKNKKIMMY